MIVIERYFLKGISYRELFERPALGRFDTAFGLLSLQMKLHAASGGESKP
jgi:hypothetical protein